MATPIPTPASTAKAILYLPFITISFMQGFVRECVAPTILPGFCPRHNKDAERLAAEACRGPGFHPRTLLAIRRGYGEAHVRRRGSLCRRTRGLGRSRPCDR